MATKKVFTWGEDTASSVKSMERSVEQFLVDELDNQDIGTVTGPKGEEYAILVKVTLKPAA